MLVYIVDSVKMSKPDKNLDRNAFWFPRQGWEKHLNPARNCETESHVQLDVVEGFALDVGRIL